jgi:hypothetical protein
MLLEIPLRGLLAEAAGEGGGEEGGNGGLLVTYAYSKKQEKKLHLIRNLWNLKVEEMAMMNLKN